MVDADQSQPVDQMLEECMAVFIELRHAFAIKARLMPVNRIGKLGVFHDQLVVFVCPAVFAGAGFRGQELNTSHGWTTATRTRARRKRLTSSMAHRDNSPFRPVPLLAQPGIGADAPVL